MRHKLAGWGASIAGLFLIAGCSSVPDEPPVTEDDFNTMVEMASNISLSQGFDMVGACKNSETYKAAIVSHSETQKVYVLQLISGRTGDGEIVKDTDTTTDMMLQKANNHCFKPG